MKTDAETPVRVRMAPSPTGHWHLGGARTALFNWLFARQHNGTFVVRIEDTDKERSKPEYEVEILETLKWLGLDWDEGPTPGQATSDKRQDYVGDYGPYRQSERTAIYRKYLQTLLEGNKAYYCYCSKEELEAERQSVLAAGLAPKYSGRCRNLIKPPAGKKPEVIRFKVPESKIEFKDLIRGVISFDGSLFGDMIIAKDLDSPLYNFAAAVDDELMKISHVLRGEEHISNTHKQILFQRAFGFREPLYGHLPLILAPDKSKLSKRYAEASILKYRDEGYLPEAIANFLALLGWHPAPARPASHGEAGEQSSVRDKPQEKEIFSFEELIKEFDLKRVQKAGAVFNAEKLDWLNAQHIKKLPIEEVVRRLSPLLEKRGASASPEFLEKVVEAERGRMKTLGDFLALADFFFELPDYEPKLLIWKDEPAETIRAAFEKSSELLRAAKLDDFAKSGLSAALETAIEKYGRGVVLWPLRVAVSGKAASPDPLQIMEILGKDETMRRLEIGKKKLEQLTMANDR